jgi:hypothetical protein
MNNQPLFPDLAGRAREEFLKKQKITKEKLEEIESKESEGCFTPVRSAKFRRNRE